MILFRLLSWPYLRRHALRSALTLAGIALGVAVFVGMHTANHAVLSAFNRTVERMAGKTQLQVTAGDGGFDEAVLERVRAVPGVRVAVPVIEAVAESGRAGQGNLLVLGVDFTGDRSLRDYDLDAGEEAILDDPLVFLAQPDSLMLTREFAARNRIALGSRLRLRTMEGEKDFTVRGLLKSGGLTSAFGGNLAVMDVYAAQKVFGRGLKFDRVDLAVADGVAVDEVRAALESSLGAGFQVDSPAGRGRQFERMVRSYALGVDISSLFALLVGMFIIYNSFAIAVTQRRAEIGILRALGASARQVRMLFLGESAIAGVVGSALGIACGAALARGAAGYIGGLMQLVYGVPLRAEEAPLPPTVAAAALAIGAVTSVVAALVPARAAARVDPVLALRKGGYQVLSLGESRRRRNLAVVLGVASAAGLAAGTRASFYAGYVLMVLAALLVTPSAALLLTRALRPLFRRLLPVEGTLAADSLLHAPRRTSATVAALMLSLAMVIGFGGVARAFFVSIDEWMDGTLNPDLFITASPNLASRTFLFPGEMGDAIADLPGVDDVQRVRSQRILYRGTPVLLISAELASLERHVRTPVVAGDRATMYLEAARGAGALVSETFAQLQETRLGDTLELDAPTGPLRLPVLGVLRDYSDQNGAVLIDRTVYARSWNDTAANLFRVYVTPGTAVADVTRRIQERFAAGTRLLVLTNAEVRRYIVQVTEQWVGMTYLQIAVALLVAVLGIVNTLTVSITDRRRQIGLLRAVGGLRRQVRRTVWMEAVGIGLIGLVLGLALGAVNLYYNREMVWRDIAGTRIPYTYPFALAGWLAPTILGAAFVAALAPAEAAVRGSLTEALEYE